MKKILLFAAFIVAMSTQAQDYWTEYATSQPAASTGMRSISVVDDNVVWLSNSCGTANCTPIRRYSLSLDSGLTWSTNAIDLGAGAANLEIANICGVSATTAFAAVFPRAAGAVGGVWKTTDSGATWTRQNTASYNGPASFCNIVHFWDENNGVTMGDPDGGFYEIYTTTNGGTNWTRVPAGNIGAAPVDPEDYGLTNQFHVTGNTIWFGTTFGKVYRSTDKGLTWTQWQTPIPDFGGGINGTESGDLAFTTETKGLLQTSDYQLFETLDGGETWNSVNWAGVLRNFGFSEIPGLPDTYISIGEDLDGSVRGSSFSTDGGLNWTSINDNPDTNYVEGGVITMRSAQVGFASGFSTSAVVGGIYKWNGVSLSNASFSNDGGFVASPNPTSGELRLSGANIANVVIFDVLGKQVFAGNYGGLNAVDLNMTAFNSGVYMVKVTNTQGNSSTIKVVRQ
jgi:photosystem II stability/assembly factor-like uncharacterized protein